jgi:hypothetical protein
MDEKHQAANTCGDRPRPGHDPNDYEANSPAIANHSLRLHRRGDPAIDRTVVRLLSHRCSIKVLPCSRAVKVADSAARYDGRVEVVGVDATGVEKAILPVSVVGYAATAGASVIKAYPLIPGITHQPTLTYLDANGGGPIVSPQGSVSAADGAIAHSEGARKAANVNSNGAAVARGDSEVRFHHSAPR